ncbi:TadE/TadG family type IV pilus assembly protein [Salinarimonas sp. NSM]|uniref:TadE/TadG family type IV pilus assembly protein n=1 Tax=Salinarimonas sp. NSM TaxID=3458003 RepID=UPI0040362421
MFDFGKPSLRKTRFWSHDAGNVAIAFALTLIPTLGLTGAAVDYTRVNAAREFARSVSDGTAVRIAAADADIATQALAGARALIESRYGDQLTAIEVTGRWLDPAHYSVRVEASLDTRILAAVPGMPREIPFTLESVTRRIPPTYVTTPPHRSLLEPEAADYNRIYMYCYDPERANEADGGRRAITPIADNGSPPTDYAAQGRTLPTCGAGEVVSYMLRNVRSARSDPRRWDAPGEQVYEYYADTVLDPETRVMIHDVRGYRVTAGTTRTPLDMRASPILETIRCATLAECEPVARGGIIPNRRTGRTPQTATQACEEGMYMYFGWEDRPPNLGWTDTDYDDIRLVVNCPVRERVTDKQVMIVR